jgi:tetratricopeptide (TPR) repeat protein
MLFSTWTASCPLRNGSGADALKATLGEMRSRYFGEATGGSGAKVRPMVRYVAGIAAAVVLVVAGFWLFRGNGRSLQELGRTEMVTSVERGGQSDSVLQQAAERFNAGDFERALPLLDQVVKADSGSQLARFYRGVTFWQLGRLGEARVDLQHIYNSGSVLEYEAAFYEALSYAKENDNSTALDWLSRIPDDAPVAAKARDLRQLLQPAR